MDFEFVLGKLLEGFERFHIRAAAIGGYALGLLGAQRLTDDLDFLVHSEDSDKLHQLMTTLGYRRIFDDENFSQYQGEIFKLWGYVDFQKASRPTARQMIEESWETTTLDGKRKVKVVRAEDVIGLKIQAIALNPQRKDKDAPDIAFLLETAKIQGKPVDWSKIEKYYKLFQMENEFNLLKKNYGV